MSFEHAGPNREIANLIPRKYNYWTKLDFLNVDYYNGNRFLLSPYQHLGPVSASNLLDTACGVCNRLGTQEKANPAALVRTRQAEMEICFSQRPMDPWRGYCSRRNACDIAQCSSGT